MLKILLGVVIGIIAVLGAEYLFLTQGGMPVATKGKPLPMERRLASRALNNAIGKDAERSSPLPANEENLLAGMRVYKAQCAVCHGALGAKDPSAIAKGMFPRPPQLMPPRKGVTDDPVGETYWKVKNGIRLSGMPGYEASLSDEEIWQVSLLLAKADQMPDTVKAVASK
jgi:mono/diheme cytochrome c family protein